MKESVLVRIVNIYSGVVTFSCCEHQEREVQEEPKKSEEEYNKRDIMVYFRTLYLIEPWLRYLNS